MKPLTIRLQGAASRLAGELGGKVSIWAWWLRSGLDGGRAHRVSGRGPARYELAAIDQLAADLK